MMKPTFVREGHGNSLLLLIARKGSDTVCASNARRAMSPCAVGSCLICSFYGDVRFYPFPRLLFLRIFDDFSLLFFS